MSIGELSSTYINPAQILDSFILKGFADDNFKLIKMAENSQKG